MRPAGVAAASWGIGPAPMELVRMHYVILYVASAIVFFAADFVWLSTMADRVYRPALGDMMLGSPVILPECIGHFNRFASLTKNLSWENGQ